MRLGTVFAILGLVSMPLIASKKVISPTTSAGNETVDIIATISMTEEEATQKIGVDPGKGVAVLEVRIVPKTDKPVQVSPDDFILLAHDDGERSKPFDPGELAGKGALVVSNTANTKTPKTSFGGGLGGLMTGSGGSPGNPKVVTLGSKMDEKRQGNQTLLDALKSKALQEKETSEPVQGLLYFPLDGKHKLRNLAVLYRGPAGRLDLEFEH